LESTKKNIIGEKMRSILIRINIAFAISLNISSNSSNSSRANLAINRFPVDHSIPKSRNEMSEDVERSNAQNPNVSKE
jgi:hypothetical protein